MINDIIKYPLKDDWSALTQRPQFDQVELSDRVKKVLSEVKNRGDQALFELTEKFDGVQLNELSVSKEEISAGAAEVSEELAGAIRLAAQNIREFHQRQERSEKSVITAPGVNCWRKAVAIEKVGLYIPGGSAPLFSTILMLGIPAKLAGCKEIILCTPPDKAGKVHPAILFAAQVAGVHNIYKIGGAQAIAAMAYGTDTVPSVYKIFGPGNQYVTMAKTLIQQDGVAIDMPAGPSEVAVVVDEFAPAEFASADLLSQAEHGPDSQVMLLSTSEAKVEEIMDVLKVQLASLPRASIATQALEKSRAILFENQDDLMAFANSYAAEHLILMTKNAEELAEQVVNAGSVFVGPFSPEAAGDYASGTNHTLPTYGYARAYSGVSLDSYLKNITFQRLTFEGIRSIGPAVETMAEAEHLDAHKLAVTVRLESNGRI